MVPNSYDHNKQARQDKTRQAKIDQDKFSTTVQGVAYFWLKFIKSFEIVDHVVENLTWLCKMMQNLKI